MGKLVKKWCLGASVLFLSFLVVFLLIIILDYKDISYILCTFLGFFFPFLAVFLFGLVINIRISKKISRVNDIVKNSIPKDVLNRNLYSNSKGKDEIEILCCDIENVMFELKASEKIKNDFISSMSHELRTPLTAIKGWAETMKMGDLIDFSTVRRGLEIIIKEVSRLSEIVDQLLDFSVMSSGKMVLNKEKIDILAEVEDAVYIFRESASIDQKKITCNEPEVPIYVYGDRSKLKQVFINIIDNSLKYTKPGGSISVNTSLKDDKVLIEITDNGCGIDKSNLSNITQKFFKVDKSMRGFGIGLSIVQEIVSAHGGSLQIFSEKGIGTTVIISLDASKEAK